ncbi:MAG: transglycosylase SLT domain-containing protein [Beijerinckiaceae bacterium]
MFLFTNSAPREAQQPQVPHATPLRQASQATGVSFDYLAKTAERESRFNPTAKASTSTATGMFQFLEQTWLGMIKNEGPKMGLGQEAAAITGESGRFSVSDSGARQKILSLREDPSVSAMMAGAFAARNGQSLQQSLGRKPTEGELYVAHFMGASGARDLIQLAQTNPDAKAASHFRDAAGANRSVFFDKSGRARSAGEVYANLTGAFSQNTVSAPQQTAATSDKAQQMFRVKGEGKPMHGLFRSQGEPVADAVSKAWAGVGRKGSLAEGLETRVAFYPRDVRSGQPVMSDATASVSSADSTHKLVNVPLPPQRPSGFEQVAVAEGGARPVRTVQRSSAPLDLMRFVKVGQRP